MNDRILLRRRGATTHRTARTVGWAATSLMLATASLAPMASAASVAPVAIDSGNPTCQDLAPAGAPWTQFKLEGAQLANGVYSSGPLTITISGYVGSASSVPGSFDWASNIGVDAVFVKAGSSKHHLYVYAPEATGDSGLSPQAGQGNGISHLSFCYDIDPVVGADPTPTPSPTATPEDEVEDATPDPTPTATPEGEIEDATPTPSPSATPVPDPTPLADPTPDPTPTPQPETVIDPTPTPEGGLLPDGDEQPECGHGPDDDTPPQDAFVPDGGVLPAIGTPAIALPETDAEALGGLRHSDDWHIVLAGLAGLVCAALILTPSRQGRIRR